MGSGLGIRSTIRRRPKMTSHRRVGPPGDLERAIAAPAQGVAPLVAAKYWSASITARHADTGSISTPSSHRPNGGRRKSQCLGSSFLSVGNAAIGESAKIKRANPA